MEIRSHKIIIMRREREEEVLACEKQKSRKLLYFGLAFRYEGSPSYNEPYRTDFGATSETTLAFRMMKFIFDPTMVANMGFAFDLSLSKRKITYDYFPYYSLYYNDYNQKTVSNYYYANSDLLLLFKFSWGTFQSSIIFGFGISYALLLNKDKVFSYQSFSVAKTKDLPRHALHYKITSGYLYTSRSSPFAFSFTCFLKFLSDYNPNVYSGAATLQYQGTASATPYN
jgi:hypothetical protein